MTGTDIPSEVRGALLNPKRQLGKYVLVSALGRGGMAEVWKAWDGELSRWVAVKFMLAPDSDDDVKRFQREAQAVARLAHPNIAAIYDTGQHDERRYIVMQYIDGKTLEGGRLPLKQTVSAVRDAARAVHYAHEHGIIHRDVKPGNLMVDVAGRVFILDFGLARTTTAESNVSLSGMIIGTPAYMAPEQAAGRIHELDARTDVYGLGATLYSLVSGRAPFDASTPGEIPHMVVHEEPESIRRLQPDVPSDLATIIGRAMEKDSNRRYPSAAHLADDLDCFLAGEPIAARAPSILYRLQRGLFKRRALVRTAFVSTALAAVFVTVAVFLVMRGRAFDDARANAGAARAAGDWSRALAECERALKMRPDAELAVLADDCRARMVRQQRRREIQDRIRPLEALIRETRPFFYIPDIDIREKIDAVERSLAELQKLAVDPASAGLPEPWVALGLGWYFVGDLTRAEEALTAAQKLLPNDPTVLHYLGRICVDHALVTLMTVDSELGEQVDNRRLMARGAIEWLQRAPAVPNADALERHVSAAYAALAVVADENVDRICRDGLEKFGTRLGTEDFWNLLACTSSGRERLDALDQALRRRPHYPWARFLRAITRHQMGDLAGAIEDQTLVISVRPRWGIPYLDRASALASLGRLQEALKDADEGVRLEPEFYASYLTRSAILLQLDRLDPAAADCSEAIRLHGRCAGAYVNRASILSRRGDLHGALESADEAIRLNPRMTRAYVNRANWRRDTGDTAGGIADCTRAIELDPHLAEAWNNRGVIHRVCSDFAAAIADFTEAVRLKPRYPEAWANRGFCLGLLDRRAEAIDSYRRCLEAAPPGWPHRGQVERWLDELRKH